MSLVTILLNLFLPPVSVFLKEGLGSSFIINIVLTLLGGLPGMVHAFWVTSKP